MKNNIDAYLNDKLDLYEKYNQNLVSKELINYIIEQSLTINLKEPININIYDNYGFEEDILKVINKGLILEYNKRKNKQQYTNIKQILLVFIGIIFLLLSMVIDENSIFKEILLIAGWVPIWEAIDIQLLSEIKERRILKILKKLINCQFNIVK